MTHNIINNFNLSIKNKMRQFVTYAICHISSIFLFNVAIVMAAEMTWKLC